MKANPQIEYFWETFELSFLKALWGGEHIQINAYFKNDQSFDSNNEPRKLTTDQPTNCCLFLLGFYKPHWMNYKMRWFWKQNKFLWNHILFSFSHPDLKYPRHPKEGIFSVNCAVKGNQRINYSLGGQSGGEPPKVIEGSVGRLQ